MKNCAAILSKGFLFIFLIFGLSFFSTPSLATDQDVVGIYFDQLGIASSFQTTASPELVSAWVVLKNISAPSGVNAIAMLGVLVGLGEQEFCGLSMIGPNVADCSPYLIFGATTPLPQGGPHAVVWTDMLIPTPDTRVDLFIKPLDMDPHYFSDAYYFANDGIPGTAIPLHPSSGSYDLPVAVINGGEVTVENSHWGAVKSLYR